MPVLTVPSEHLSMPPPAPLPPLKQVRAGLRRATEALAEELALVRPGGVLPQWSELEWRLASAAAVAHGVAPLLHRFSTWQKVEWRRFLDRQRQHVAERHLRIEALLRRADALFRAAGVPVLALKGAALHGLGLYAPGDRPMADIDLLVRAGDADRAAVLLGELGYAETFAQWKHRVFKPVEGGAVAGLGEHRDTPVNIELHTHIHERLPTSIVDITPQVFPSCPRPGLNPYPSNGALMSHLLLHAAGNICGRTLRLLHLNDISLLATRMTLADWEVLWSAGPPWWALPPLRLVARYYHNAVPAAVLRKLRRDCPWWLRAASRQQTLTRVSCSDLWLQAFPGIEWSRTPLEALRYLRHRFVPDQESRKERQDMVRTQLYLQGQTWVTRSHGRRLLRRLAGAVPRMDTLYVVRKALETVD
jgi:hypothetical protein